MVLRICAIGRKFYGIITVDLGLSDKRKHANLDTFTQSTLVI